MYMKCFKCGNVASFKIKIQKSHKETVTHICGNCVDKVTDKYVLIQL